MGKETKFIQREREAFFTSHVLASFLAKKTVTSFIEEGGNLKKATFLEPSAGQGALVDALISEVQKITHEPQEEIEKRITIVELDKEDYLYLKNKYKNAEVINEDFILYDLDKVFDIIIANPPWSKYVISTGDFYEKYMLRLSGVCAKTKEKIYTKFIIENNLVDEYASWKAAKEKAYKAYKKAYPVASSIDQCFLLKCKELLTCSGISGFLMPCTIYEACKSKDMRKRMYQSLRYLFRFHNELRLFEDVNHHTKYTMSIFGKKDKNNFTLVDNLFHPQTIEGCENERQEAPYPGFKDKKGNWELRGHPKRMITVDKDLMEKISSFTGSNSPWTSVLPTLHGEPEKKLFIKLSELPKMRDIKYSYHSGMHESGAPKKGLITRAPNKYPPEEMVMTGPNIFVGNPAYKEPNPECKSKGDFTLTELQTIPRDFLPSTVYQLTEKGKISPEYLRKTPWGKVHNFEFRVAAREFVGSTTGERTLQVAIIPPILSHINAIFSLSFHSIKTVVLTESLFISIILDFLVRTLSNGHVNKTLIQTLLIIPLTAENNLLVQALAARTLRLNCLSNHYAPLYQEIISHWKRGIRSLDLGNLYKDKMDSDFISETLEGSSSPCGYGMLPDEWSPEVPLRKIEDREQALCEIDALVAVLLGIDKDTLLNIYRAQFAVLQKNYQDFPDQTPKAGKPHFPRYRVMEAAFDAIKTYQNRHQIPTLKEELKKGAKMTKKSNKGFSLEIEEKVKDKIKFEYVSTEDLVPYARNAKRHPEEQINKIASSIKEFGFISPVVISEDKTILAGHGRVMAAKKLGLKQVPTIKTSNLTEAQKKAFILADNRTGEEHASWDTDLLQVELEELEELDFDISDMMNFGDLFPEPKESEEDNRYTTKIEAPIYTPKEETQPALAELFDDTMTKKLEERINEADIHQEIKDFLFHASKRHTKFRYDRIAEYYCHASKEVQALMEESALVIIDADKAIENGFMKLVGSMKEAYKNDYPE